MNMSEGSGGTVDRERRTGPVIAIDGPAGVGKSTLGLRLAQSLGVPFVNTGLMYRAVAARAVRLRIDPDDAEALAGQARAISFGLDDAVPPQLSIDGAPPATGLTAREVEAAVSRVSSHPQVRTVLRARQRELGSSGCVMEGRDIGSDVLPDADVKVLLTASPGVRARRRESERAGDPGAAVAVALRDELDARTTPLIPGPDTHLVDTTGVSADEVFERVLRLIHTAGQR